MAYKMGFKDKKIVLKQKDFDFIDAFFKYYHLVEGRGHKKILWLFLNEYKKAK